MVIANNTMMMTKNKKKKVSQGRKKIEMKKIDKESSLQVTFSKRRNGLFNKASELCVLTGAQIAVVAQSPGGNFFTFGYPNADLLIDRYLNGRDSQPEEPSIPVGMNEFNQEYTKICKELEVEKKKKSLEINRGESSTGRKLSLWWEEFEPFDDRVGLEEVEEYMVALQELKMKVLLRADDLMLINSSSKLFSSTNLNLVKDEMMMNQTENVYVAGVDPLMMENSSLSISSNSLLQGEMINQIEKHEYVGMEQKHNMMNSSSLISWTDLMQNKMTNLTENDVGMEEPMMMNSSLSISLTDLLQDEMMNQKENYVGMDGCNIENNYDLNNMEFDFSDIGMVTALGSDFEEDKLFGLSVPICTVQPDATLIW